MAGLEVVVKKLPIARYIQIIERLEALPSVAVNAVTGDVSNIGALVVAAIRVGSDEFFDIVSLASGLDKDTLLNEVALDELVEFVEALIEVNRLQMVAGKIGAALRRFIPALKGA
jgi:hypothetical protein